MKRKIFLMLTMVAMLVCIFALSASADTISVTNEDELISALNQSTTVTLANDITLTKYTANETHILGSGKTSILDLNGYILTSPENCYISNIGGNLTIADSSEEKTGKIVAVGIYSINGTLTINGGTIEQTYTDDYTRSNSVLLCYGNTVVNDANIVAKSTVFYVNNGSASLIVNGGNYKSEGNALINAYNGTIIVNNGNFLHDGDPLVTANNGSVYINGGSFSGKVATVYSGDRLAINGGKFAFDVSEYLSDFYEQNEDGEVVQLPITTPEVLIAALSAGGTVKMASDIVLTNKVSNESHILTKSVVVTLDLNGYTLTAPDNCFVSTRGTFTIMDSSENKTGKIVGAGIYSMQNSTLVIDGITIEQVITNNVAKEAILSYGNTRINDVNVIAQYGVVGIYAGATVEIYDGNFKTTHESEYIKENNGTLKVYGGTYSGTNAMTIKAFVQNGYTFVEKTGEVLKNVSLDECFVCLGYSAPEDGRGGIAIGYTVNNKMILQYEKITGKTLKYGVFAVAKDKLGENDIFTENGTVSDGVINAEISNYNFAAFELKIVGFTDTYKDTKLAIGAYVTVTDGKTTEYSYMQFGEPNGNEKYCFTSYNEVANSESTTDGEVA